MTAAKARSDSERLQLAKAEVPRVEARIDAVMERRRGILRREHANGLPAIRADRELAALKLLRLRLIDQIELLGRAGPLLPSVAPERSGWTWPSDLEGANAALLELQPELLRLRSIKPVDRHVGHDDQIDFLVQREYRLLRLIESFQPKSMVAS